MRGLFFLAGLSLSVTPALAGPMPALPDLPPLPTTYASSYTSGFYAGVLAGYSSAGPGAAALGVVIGNTFYASDLLIGAEGLVIVSKGDVSLDASVRAGFSITSDLSVHGSLGFGHSTATQGFAAAGLSAEFLLSADSALRFDYRYQHDFSGDPATHKILGGLVRRF